MKEEGGKWKEGGRQNKRKNGRCRTRKNVAVAAWLYSIPVKKKRWPFIPPPLFFPI